MYPFDKTNPARLISIKLLLKPLLRSGLSANQITVLNFLLLGLGSIVLFATGHDYWGLLTAGLMAMVDYCDGEVARFDNKVTILGAQLDTSLDYLYLMLLFGALGYSYHLEALSYLILAQITFSNWLQYNGKVSYQLPFFLQIVFLLPLSILIQEVPLGFTVILFSQAWRMGQLYGRSIECWKES